ncbi:zinc-binding dehydrogenase [Streptomyces sp. NPDC051064]|uniref:zinc-binding dehydrogenase n=1 Tax=Streptomyces sp. NPDC051064 TaxID=3365641 RepID=UPI0037BCBB85
MVERVAANETVAVIGAGGVGLNAVSAARIAGASRIVAVDVQDGELRRALAFGATDVVIRSRSDGSCPPGGGLSTLRASGARS